MSDSVKNQSDLLLTTKLNPPLIRSDVLDRPQLIARLELDVRRPLTLISAPAGYGKSTLAAQLLETSSEPGVWLSLDRGDNELRVFLSYIVAAMQRLHSTACKHIRDLLNAAQLPPPDILAKILANDLELISEPYLLVLDDFHVITNPDIHDVIDQLLQHPPRSLHLVIVSRRDPPFPLVKMKAHGLAVEIRESDLQFDKNETAQVLARVGNINLDEEGLDRISDDIEGWITGLRLFCLAAERGDDPRTYLLGMGGGATQVQDYLVEQVISRQVPELQSCLLKTSILDRLCAPLCEAVCTESADANPEKAALDGRLFMDTIIKTKLFGILLQADGKWIRYHHLFQEILRNQLQKNLTPKAIADLHRQAAQWFAEQGLIEEGLKHAQAAGDFELAADIIADARLEVMNADTWHHLGMWLDSLPPGIENSRPHLLMFRAWVTLQSLRIAELPALLARLVALEGESPDDPMLAGELDFYRGVILFFIGDLEASKRHLDAGLRLLPETNVVCRCECEYFSHVLLHMDGKRELAINGLREAIKRNQNRDPFYQTRLVFALYFVHGLAGHWPDALRAAAFLDEFSRPNDFAYAVVWAIYLQGYACLQMGDLEEADQFYREVFKRRFIHGRRGAIDAIAGHTLCLQLQGREAAADECLNEAHKFAFWTGDPAQMDIVGACKARVALLRGQTDAAARWLSTYNGQPEGPVRFFFLEYPEITACRVLVARGTPEYLEQAETRLELLEAESRQFHNDCQLVPVLVLKSLLCSKTNRVQGALDILTEAVGLAWPGRWILPFIEGGKAVAELLRQLPENPEWGGFIDHTLSRYDQQQGNGTTQPSKPEAEEALIIDLTNREIDVLELLCERLYDKEIADRLFISPATVKTHLSHIYGKLEVTNRREAAIKARQLKLV